MELQGAEGDSRSRRRQGSKHLNFLGRHRLRLDIRKTLLCRRLGQSHMGV